MSSKNPLEDKLLNRKKAKFLEVVEKIAKHLKVPVPKVQFWECPDYTGNEIAHIHPDLNMICISERDLNKLNYDDIKETASHEVEHLRDTKPETTPIHSPDFYMRLGETQRETWEAEHPGLVITRGNEKVTKPGKLKPFKPDKIRCNYYQGCDKTTSLEQCALCKRFFCEDHILPSETSIGVKRLDHEFSPKTHPCPDYSVLPDSKKREFITYFIALKNYKKDLENWKKENKEIEQENQIIKNEWEKKHKGWMDKCNLLCKDHTKDIKKWEEECKKIKKKYLEEKQRLEKEYGKNLRTWEDKCKKIEKENKENFKRWEDDCNNSTFGFFKKILRMGKLKVLGLPEKPSKKKLMELELPNKPQINLPQEPEKPKYFEPKSKPEFEVLKYLFK